MDITAFIVHKREDIRLLGGYDTYWRRISRRVTTLRQKLGKVTPKGKKYSQKAQISADEIRSNAEYLHLLILECERAWAQAMHAKTAHGSVSGKGVTGSTRSHLISRLRKASELAEQLIEKLKDRSASGAQDEDILEITAYQYSLAGQYYLEKQSWETSLQKFAGAHIIYNALAKSKPGSDSYHEMLSTTVDPSVRFAAYKLKLPASSAVDAISKKKFPNDGSEICKLISKIDESAWKEQAIASASSESASVPAGSRSVSWRQHTAIVEDSSILAALFAFDEASQKLNTFFGEKSRKPLSPREKSAAYDDVLMAAQEVVDSTRHAIDVLASEGVSQGDKRMQNLQVTWTAVNYSLIGVRVGRNRVLVGEGGEDDSNAKLSEKDLRRQERENTSKRLSHFREQVALHDATLQSLDSVKELPGVASDPQFAKELAAKRTYFHSQKLLSLAGSYRTLQTAQGNKNALALVHKASTALQSNIPSLFKDAKETVPTLEVSKKEVKTLLNTLQGQVTHLHGLCELDLLSSSQKVAALQVPLIERLDTYYPSTDEELLKLTDPDSPNLVTYPINKIDPVPVKPIFLDIAWNCIKYPIGADAASSNKKESEPSLKTGEKTESEEAAGKEEKKRGGWFGFGR